jgi:phage portal protein BeeE
MAGDVKEKIFIVGVREIAQALGIGVNYVKALLRTDGFPPVKIGAQWICTREALVKWSREYMRSGGRPSPRRPRHTPPASP